MGDLKRIKGDASFRNFFRKKEKNSNSIIVYSKKEKEKNLLVYDAINKILIKNKILAPKLISENYSKNFIEIQDFGTQTIFQKLKKKNSKKYHIYKKIIFLLKKLQLIKEKKIKNFLNDEYLIPEYSQKIILKEARLYSDWYASSKLSKKKYLKFKTEYNQIIKNLIKKIQLKNNVFVHRDFHISNLMLVKKKIGVIDSQDALIGNKAYDLASLIDDVRFKTSKKLKNRIFNLYLKNQKNLDIKKFKNDFDIISVLRNLKIIGIFTRLAVRDDKKNYLRLIPHAKDLIKLRTDNNNLFYDLTNLLNKTFYENR